MPLRLKNTLTDQIEEFQPASTDGIVRFYSCGPTVYSYAHIGNFRSFLLADLIHRVLIRRGFVVRQVMNITDVGHMTEDHLADAEGEDKLARAARQLGSDPFKVAEFYEKAFLEDAKTLGLLVREHPRATRHIAEMLRMIQRLIDGGFAYVDSRGQVYFEVATFPDYGKLSGKVLDELEAGARVAVREEKRDPRDFALWKVDEKHLMQWDPRALVPEMDARVKAGFPGWHIECSAMALASFGAQIDIHTGGEDNIFPHHECEIAQSHSANGVPFARYWVHGRFLLVDGKKMSKRDGTFFTVRDFLEPRGDLVPKLEALGFAEGKVPANVLRYALLSNSYGQPMSFGFDVLAQAKASVERIQSAWRRLREARSIDAPPSVDVDRHLAAFDAALDDNLNTPNALSAVFALIADLNKQETLHAADTVRGLNALDAMDAIFGIIDRSAESGVLTRSSLEERTPNHRVLQLERIDAEAVADVLALREQARAARNFKRADELRAHLARAGVTIEDTPTGIRWRR
jgi:cysteinyl-tRNA synthetase